MQVGSGCFVLITLKRTERKLLALIYTGFSLVLVSSPPLAIIGYVKTKAKCISYEIAKAIGFTLAGLLVETKFQIFPPFQDSLVFYSFWSLAVLFLDLIALKFYCNVL